MSENLWTFLFEIANFVSLAAILAWLLFKPVRKAIEDQSASVRRMTEEAEQHLAEAKKLRQEISSRHASLATELEKMRTQAIEVAKQEAQQIVADARAKAEKERASLSREALNIEKSQTFKIAHAVATATQSAVRRFLKQMGGPELERILVKAACEELKMVSSNKLFPVTIESANRLDQESQEMIEQALGTAANKADFRVVPEIQGGLRISTGNGLIDASVEGLANFAERSLLADLESMIRQESQNE